MRGNLSLTHFILVFILVVGVLKFLTIDLFGHMNLFELTDGYKNAIEYLKRKKNVI